MKSYSKMLKDEDVARMFGVKPQTVRIWRIRGTGPPYIVAGDRSIRYDPIDLEHFLAARRVKPGKGTKK